MKLMKGWAALGLVVCVAFMTTATAGMCGEIVPHQYQAHETIVINLMSGSATFSGSGQATHAGLFNNAGTAQVDLNTMAWTGDGTLTAADGSQILWDGSGILGGEMRIVLTGGTGRFANVSGELPSWETTNLVQTVDGYLLTLTADTRATGWISF